jgi:hypothetical protein
VKRTESLYIPLLRFAGFEIISEIAGFEIISEIAGFEIISETVLVVIKVLLVNIAVVIELL